jgi:hypothetical protein
VRPDYQPSAATRASARTASANASGTAPCGRSSTSQTLNALAHVLRKYQQPIRHAAALSRCDGGCTPARIRITASRTSASTLDENTGAWLKGDEPAQPYYKPLDILRPRRRRASSRPGPARDDVMDNRTRCSPATPRVGTFPRSTTTRTTALLTIAWRRGGRFIRRNRRPLIARSDHSPRSPRSIHEHFPRPPLIVLCFTAFAPPLPPRRSHGSWPESKTGLVYATTANGDRIPDFLHLRATRAADEAIPTVSSAAPSRPRPATRLSRIQAAHRLRRVAAGGGARRRFAADGRVRDRRRVEDQHVRRRPAR